MKRITTIVAIAALGLILAACQQQAEGELGVQDAPDTYLLTANGLPEDFADVVAANGDTLNALHATAGFASVTTTNPDAYERFARSIVRDVTFTRAPSDDEPIVIGIDDPLDQISAQFESSSLEVSGIVEPPFTGDDDFFFDLQWGHDAVNAQAAWAAGHRGVGVRVAILDGGTDLDHPDLAPNTNFALSKDFTGQGLDFACDGAFSIAAHVGGIVAAADNGFGTIGVAPEAELVWVKVLSDVRPPGWPFCTSSLGSFSNVISGILYAADIGADVIHLGLNIIIFQGQGPGSDGVAALRGFVNQAITYANNAGATVIVSTGNFGFDLDGADTASMVNFMGFASHAVSVSALGPVGWAIDPGNVDLDTQSEVTNIGTEIDFAAPGGKATHLVLGNEMCTIAATTRPCFIFDNVFSTGNNGWYWQRGAERAAAYATGVAALIIGEHGGDLKPAQVRRIMRQRADDLGRRGVDDLYGHGRVASGY